VLGNHPSFSVFDMHHQNRCNPIQISNVISKPGIELFRQYTAWRDTMPQNKLMAEALDSVYAYTENNKIIGAPLGHRFNTDAMTFVPNTKEKTPLAFNPNMYWNTKTNTAFKCWPPGALFDPVSQKCYSPANKCNTSDDVLTESYLMSLGNKTYACVGPYSIQQTEQQLTDNIPNIQITNECLKFKNMFIAGYKPVELLYLSNSFACVYDPIDLTVKTTIVPSVCQQNIFLNPSTQNCAANVCKFNKRAFPRHPFLIATCNTEEPFVFCPNEEMALDNKTLKCIPKIPVTSNLPHTTNPKVYYDKTTGQLANCPLGQLFYNGECILFSGTVSYVTF
jgi:hypothetical protein